ncbi:MAG: hypothetical protein KF754_08270 [Planctomycetes bacterium]|nr:hypothetical protein [Planctomycetota bacterium]
MRTRLTILAAALALGFAVAWLGVGGLAPARLEVSQGQDPAPPAVMQPSATAPELVRPAGPAPSAPASPAPAKTFVPPPLPAAPDLSDDLATLEAHWLELRRQGRWREAEPVGQRVKAMRASRQGPKEPEPLIVRIDPDQAGGAWGPAPREQPRLDLLPGPLPGQGEGIARGLEVPGPTGSLELTLACAAADVAGCKVRISFMDQQGNLLCIKQARADASGRLDIERVPVAAATFKIEGDGFQASGIEACVIRKDETTRWGRLTLVARDNR